MTKGVRIGSAMNYIRAREVHRYMKQRTIYTPWALIVRFSSIGLELVHHQVGTGSGAW